MTKNYPDGVTMSKAYRAATGVERSMLLGEWLPAMADGLGGIAALCDLAYVDPLRFLLGLKKEVRRNSANLTALRALIWFSMRFDLDGEAEVAFRMLAKSWPNHDEAFVERMRYLILAATGAHDEFLQKNIRHFRRALTVASYEVQACVASGEAHPELFTDFLKLCSSTLDAALQDEARKTAQAAELGNDLARLRHAIEKLRAAQEIAIVGNGPSLRGSGKGAEIDSFPLVIRCNFPAIAGHETDVGARTDIVFYSETIRPAVPRALDRHPNFSQAIKLAVHTPTGKIVPDGIDDGTLTGIGRLPIAIQQAISDLSYVRATTGLMAITFVALLVGKRVRLYGFDFFKDTDDAHYFDKQIGAFLGHEIQYERWFVEKFLGAISR